MFRFAALAVSASLLVNSSAIATEQLSAKISAGHRVRITNDSGQLIGTVVAVTGDNIRITDGAQERAIALADVKRIEVSRGTTSKGAGAKKGALRWGLIFAGIGAVSLGLQHDDVGEDGSSVGE